MLRNFLFIAVFFINRRNYAPLLGVDATMIDAELGKVTVSGYVHPNILIKKLVKSGKHAELWTAPKNNPYAARNGPGNQFHDLQFENIGKPQKGGNGKGFNHDLNTKMGHKAPKSVRFDIPEYQFPGSDSEFSGSEDDDDGDSLELDFGRRPPSRTPTRGGGGGGGYGQQGKKDNRNGPGKKGKSSGGKSEKGGIFGLRLPFFGGFGRKKKGKNSSARKKGGGGGGAKAGCMRLEAIEFKNGKGMAATKNGSNNKLKGGGGGNNQTNGGKNSRGGGQYDNFQEIDIANHRKGGGGGGGYGGAGGGGFGGGMGAIGNYPVGHMGNNAMGPIGNYPIGPMSNNSFGSMGHYPAVSQMGNYQAAPGMPAPAPINGGYYPGAGPMAMNQQHYTGMMMGQPHQQFSGMLHPTAYGRPPPTADYALHRASDGYSNMFNDESTESCSIM